MSVPPNVIHLCSAFSRFISVPRFEAYRQPGDDDLEVLTKCVWNACLSEALYPVLQNLEIGLRNALHTAAEGSFGSPRWFKRPGVLQMPEEIQIKKAEDKLQRLGRPLEPSRIIAELDFGFWTTLFDKRYDRLLNRPGLLRAAFNPMPRRIQTRHTLSKRFNDIRKLRNRVFHHERILHWDLAQEHADIIEAIGWISTTLRKVTQAIDRFPLVIDPAFRAQLNAKLAALG